jgi:hypothetical protein
MAGIVAAALTSQNGASPAYNSAVESTLVDNNLLALLEAVQTGQIHPQAAALQLRERSAGYQQVPHMSRDFCVYMSNASQMGLVFSASL